MSNIGESNLKSNSKIIDKLSTNEEKLQKIEKLLNGYTSKSEEKQILNILLNSKNEDLCKILDKIDTKKLVSDINKNDLNKIINKLETENTESSKFHSEILKNSMKNSDKEVTFFSQGFKTIQKSINDIKEGSATANLEMDKATLIAKIDSSNMTPEQKEKAKKILENLNGDSLDEFKILLDKGLLTKKDSKGVSILDRLDKIISEERHSKIATNNISSKDILNQTVKTLANPLSTKQGDGKGTCGACTMEYLILNNDPAEFVRMVEELTSKKGSVTLRDGKKLTLPTNSIPKDNSGRSDVDRMLQSSIMNEANLMGASYDNPSDNGGFWAVLGGNSAIGINDFKKLYQSITGRKMDSQSSYLWGEKDVAARIENALARNEKVPVLMSFGGAFAYHWLTVEKINYDDKGNPKSVVLRNPWGEDNGSGNPPRKSLGNGLIEMKWSDFVKNVDGSVLPEDIGNKPISNEKMPVQARVNVIKELMSGYTNGGEEKTIKDILTSSSGKDLSDILDKLNIGDIISELDDKDVSKVMLHLAKNINEGNNANHLLKFISKADDDISYEFIKSMSDDQLKELAKNPKGREILNKAWNNMDSGWTTDSEEKQMNRIKKALK